MRLRDCGMAKSMGQRPNLYQHGATPHVIATKPMSANGAVHSSRPVEIDTGWRVALWNVHYVAWGMERAFSPWDVCGSETWGVCPRLVWGAPLALRLAHANWN